MSSVISFLQGKKTYITAVLFGIFNLGLAIGWWTPDNQVVLAVNSIFATFGWAFMRAGVTKSGQPSNL